MRDPNRITAYCDKLATIWRMVPDWRFGQLMSNLLGAYAGTTKRDIFFPEDEELFKFFEDYVGRNSPYHVPKDGGAPDEK